MNASTHIPIGAEEISVDWLTLEGGIRIYAYTDKKGIPYLGPAPLNRMGQPNGLPCRHRCYRYGAEIVVGFRGEEAIVINVDARVSAQGVHMVVHAPSDVIPVTGYAEYSFRAWGSEAPSYRFTAGPANSNWPVNPFPWNLDEGVAAIVHGD